MEQKMLKIEFARELRQINCSSGYFVRFYENTGIYPNHRVAWEKLEDERITYGLEMKYSTYESFRVAKNNFMDIKII